MAAILIACIFLAVIPSVIAARKGRSVLGYYLFGLFFFVPALIVVLLVPEMPHSLDAMLKRNAASSL